MVAEQEVVEQERAVDSTEALILAAKVAAAANRRGSSPPTSESSTGKMNPRAPGWNKRLMQRRDFFFKFWGSTLLEEVGESLVPALVAVNGLAVVDLEVPQQAEHKAAQHWAVDSSQGQIFSTKEAVADTRESSRPTSELSMGKMNPQASGWNECCAGGAKWQVLKKAKDSLGAPYTKKREGVPVIEAEGEAQASEQSVGQTDPKTLGWTRRARIGAAAPGRTPCTDCTSALEKESAASQRTQETL
nr:uncharacterized protein LOC109759540 isoform X2 [Aegilops tauschii subsp. strangulata]